MSELETVLPARPANDAEVITLIERDGFALLKNALDCVRTDWIKEKLDNVITSSAVRSRADDVFAIRHVCERSHELRNFANSSEIRTMLKPILGDEFRLVNSTLFDKVPRANWKVTWHQDMTISVREKKDAPGFTCWTRKAGVTNVQPPAEIMGKMLAVRIHLDETYRANGALKVIPGSHNLGRLSACQLGELKARGPIVQCNAPSGGILIMRPLLLHSSSSAELPCHRRVMHLEFSAAELPYGLEWYSS